MAEFEGNLSLNVETSEIEIKGKFKLTEDELSKVAGGQEENQCPRGFDSMNDSCVANRCAHAIYDRPCYFHCEMGKGTLFDMGLHGLP